MKTSVLAVAGLLSPLSARGIEKMLLRQPGVHGVSVNAVDGSALVHFDEARTTLAGIEEAVRACGHHCLGEMTPRHLCATGAVPRGEPVGAPDATAPAAPMHRHDAAAAAPIAAPPAVGGHAGHAMPAGTDAMAHDMGHAAGMDMAAMVRDMRNRFVVALAFAVPLFFLSPMGGGTAPATSVGSGRDLLLFVLGSGAVIYPGWPFYVSAVRALRNGVLNMATLVFLSVGTGYVFSIGATFLWAATSSTKRRPRSWCSSCSGIGWKCGRAPVRPTPFAP